MGAGPNQPAPSFVVELAQFSGPLDLLLVLLRDEQVDIYDIPIARVAEQFLARIHDLGLDEAADYLEMAARLLRIKAQMLLPRHDGDEAWEDPRAELVRRLLEYQQMREVVDVLERHAEARRDRFGRPALAIAQLWASHTATAVPLALTFADLLSAVDRVARAGRGVAMHAVVPRALDVPGALVALRALLAERGRASWETLLHGSAEPWEVLSLLLAVLELARLGECVVFQTTAFGPLELARGSAWRADCPRDLAVDMAFTTSGIADAAHTIPIPSDPFPPADSEPASAAA